jgi:hypothetical protein
MVVRVIVWRDGVSISGDGIVTLPSADAAFVVKVPGEAVRMPLSRCRRLMPLLVEVTLALSPSLLMCV